VWAPILGAEVATKSRVAVSEIVRGLLGFVWVPPETIGAVEFRSGPLPQTWRMPFSTAFLTTGITTGMGGATPGCTMFNRTICGGVNHLPS